MSVTAVGVVAGGWALQQTGTGAVAGRIVASGVVVTAAWVIGVAVRQQRAYAAGLREQAEQRVQAQLAEGRRAVTEERLRIARELHDVVAHSLSLIAVQAGVGSYVAGGARTRSPGLWPRSRPPAAARCEMRRLLGVLRDDHEGPGLEPAPGLADLGHLIKGTADAGVGVQLEVKPVRRHSRYRSVPSLAEPSVPRRAPTRPEAGAHADEQHSTEFRARGP